MITILVLFLVLPPPPFVLVRGRRRQLLQRRHRRLLPQRRRRRPLLRFHLVFFRIFNFFNYLFILALFSGCCDFVISDILFDKNFVGLSTK